MARVFLSTGYAQKAGTPFIQWDSTTGWSTNSFATIALDSMLTPSGDKTARLKTTEGNRDANLDKSLTADLSDPETIISISFFCPNDFLGDTFQIHFYSTFPTDEIWFGFSSTRTLAGWNRFNIKVKDMTTVGSPVLNSINSVRLKIVGSGTANISELVLGPMVFNDRAKPKIMVQFDDGVDNVISTAKPIMDARGIPGTVFVGGKIIGTGGKMTLSDLQALKAAGWTVASHTWSQDPLSGPPGNYTPSQQLSELQQNKDWLSLNGFDASYLSYPGGVYDDAIRSLVNQVGIQLARTTQGDSKLSQITTSHGKHNFDIINGDSFDSNQWTVLQDIYDLIDSAIDTGRSLMLYGHSVVSTVSQSTDISTADFTSIMDYIKGKMDLGLIDAVNLDDWYKGLDHRSRLMV